MSEWDKLWKEKPGRLIEEVLPVERIDGIRGAIRQRSIFHLIVDEDWLKRLKTEGDKIQEENNALHELNATQFQEIGRYMKIERKFEKIKELTSRIKSLVEVLEG